MKIIYTFLWGWAPLPVITASENESGGAGNFHVTEAWCILRLWADCSSDEHRVESFACACDNSPSLTRPLSFSGYWCILHKCNPLMASAARGNVGMKGGCERVCAETKCLIHSRGGREGGEQRRRASWMVPIPLSCRGADQERESGSRWNLHVRWWYLHGHLSLGASSTGMKGKAGCGGEEPKRPEGFVTREHEGGRWRREVCNREEHVLYTHTGSTTLVRTSNRPHGSVSVL